ncbi:MAG: TRAP transporter large permease [Lachnospiraceae bacterium]|nr:TRAP transporter large permease [Lachnospiraceae bacterium]
MSNVAAIFIVLLIFVVMLLLEHRISTCLFISGIIGVFLVTGPSLIAGFLTNTPYATVASYTLTTLPLYIIMAQFIMKAGIIKELYNMTYRLSGGRGWVLGVMTTILGGFLGAVSGSGTATAAGLSQCAYPELRKRGFSKELACTLCATSGSLSAVIPPSTLIVLYGVTAQVSVATLFIATLIPGISMLVVYAVLTVIYYFVEKRGNRVQELDEHEFEFVTEEEDKESKGQHMLVVISGLLIIIVIFGGIYSGFFTPTEAGAVGAFVAFIAAIVSGNFSLKFFIQAIVDTVQSEAMIMFMVLSAAYFSRFITLSMIPRYIVSLLTPLIAHPAILLAILIVFYFVMFMLMDGTAPILMTVPIMMPVVQAAGYDPIWFGILVAMSATIGQLTPPVGLGVYTVSSITKVPSGGIFKIATIYALAVAVVVGGAMILIPGMTSWLPSLLQ